MSKDTTITIQLQDQPYNQAAIIEALAWIQEQMEKVDLSQANYLSLSQSLDAGATVDVQIYPHPPNDGS